MAWNDAPPTKDELAKVNWASQPPTAQELAALKKTAPISETESALRGAAQGATFGFAPALSGAVQALPGILSDDSSTLLDRYRKARDASKSEFDAAAAANPKSYLAGSLGGGLLPALLTGGASEAASAAGAADTLGSMALTGAKYGAVAGAGDALSSGHDLGDATKDIVGNAAGGAVLGAGIGKLGGAIASRFGQEGLENGAAYSTGRAIGLPKGLTKRMAIQDVKNASYAAANGEEAPTSKLLSLSQDLLNPNEFNDASVTKPFSSTEGMIERAQDTHANTGKFLGDTLQKFDGNFNDYPKKFVQANDLSNDIESQLLTSLQVNPKASVGEPGRATMISNEAKAKAVNEVLDTIAQFGDGPLTFEEAQRIKQSFSDVINENNSASAAESAKNKAYRQARAILNNHIENAAENVAQAQNNPEQYTKFKRAKELYGSASLALESLTGKLAGEQSNNHYGLTDYMAAGAMAAHGLPGELAGAVINNTLKRYGHSVAAPLQNSMSNVVGTVNKTLIDMPKESLANYGTQLMSSDNPLAQKLGNVLSTINQRDDIGRNALVFSLMQNPGYRQLINQMFGVEPNKP